MVGNMNIDIDDRIYKKWVSFYKKQDKVLYPSLKNFTAKKLQEVMQNGK